MALNLPSVPNILPSKVRQAAEAFGGYVVQGTHAASHPLEQGWGAFQQHDPQDAAIIRSFLPDSPANLFNLATVLVPGAKGGRAGAMPLPRGTPAQASLLKAIYNSSRGVEAKNRVLWNNKSLFQPLDPSSASLAALAGQPLAQRASVGGGALPMSWARNPLTEIQKRMYPESAGKIGPGQVWHDLGGRPTHHPSGMDVPPLPGELGSYFPAEPKADAAQHLFDILMGYNPQN